MKRGNDNSQLRAEEVEALNDVESVEAGEFRRASEDVLKQRRIVKPRRITSEDTASTTSGNPFAGGFTGLTSTGSPATSNPFSGFTGFGSFAATAGSSITSSVPKSISAPIPAAVSSFASHKGEENKKDVMGKGFKVEEYQKKLRKLNQSFSSWLDRQISENPLSIWSDGLKDYIKYCSLLAEQYGISESDSLLTDDQPSTNDAPAPAAPVSANSTPNGGSSFPSSSKQPPAYPPPAASSFSFPSAAAATFSVPLPAGAPSTFAAKSFPSFAPSLKGSISTAAPVAPSIGGVNTGGTGGGTGLSFSSLPAPAAADGGGGLLFTGIKTGDTKNPGALFSAPSFSFPTPALPAFSGFGAASTPTNAVPAVGFAPASADDDEGGDDAGEPILEPEKILRNEDDKDVVLHDVPCKLYRFNELKEWGDLGKGNLRITQDPQSKKQRLVIRNTMGKLLVNAYFFKEMKFESAKNSIKFSAFVDETDIKGGTKGLRNFNVKLKESDFSKTLGLLEAAKKSCV